MRTDWKDHDHSRHSECPISRRSAKFYDAAFALGLRAIVYITKSLADHGQHSDRIEGSNRVKRAGFKLHLAHIRFDEFGEWDITARPHNFLDRSFTPTTEWPSATSSRSREAEPHPVEDLPPLERRPAIGGRANWRDRDLEPIEVITRHSFSIPMATTSKPCSGQASRSSVVCPCPTWFEVGIRTETPPARSAVLTWRWRAPIVSPLNLSGKRSCR